MPRTNGSSTEEITNGALRFRRKRCNIGCPGCEASPIRTPLKPYFALFMRQLKISESHIMSPCCWPWTGSRSNSSTVHLFFFCEQNSQLADFGRIALRQQHACRIDVHPFGEFLHSVCTQNIPVGPASSLDSPEFPRPWPVLLDLPRTWPTMPSTEKPYP